MFCILTSSEGGKARGFRNWRQGCLLWIFTETGLQNITILESKEGSPPFPGAEHCNHSWSTRSIYIHWNTACRQDQKQRVGNMQYVSKMPLICYTQYS